MSVEYCNLCNGTGYVREGYDGESPCPLCNEGIDLNAFNCLNCERWITGEEAARRMDGYCDECTAKREGGF